MRKQQQIWEEAHKKATDFPSVKDQEPSSNVVWFLDFLTQQNILPPKMILDIGSGNGRNAVFLAKKGFNVIGIDYANYAVRVATDLAKKNNVEKNTQFISTELDYEWNVYSDYFDAALDCYASIDIETPEGRETYKKQLLRALKKEAYVLVTVVSVDDEIEKELLRTNPGPEKYSTLWPGTGKFQKNYDEDELQKFYRDFKIITLERIEKDAEKLGKKYKAVNFRMIIQKPI